MFSVEPFWILRSMSEKYAIDLPEVFDDAVSFVE